MKTVVYHGYEFQVPASWPVYRLDQHPTTCVRYDVHAVYLGTPGVNMQCPAGLVGRTQTVSVIPSTTVAAGSGSDDRRPAPAAGRRRRHRGARAARRARGGHPEPDRARAAGRARRGVARRHRPRDLRHRSGGRGAGARHAAGRSGPGRADVAVGLVAVALAAVGERAASSSPRSARRRRPGRSPAGRGREDRPEARRRPRARRRGSRPSTELAGLPANWPVQIMCCRRHRPGDSPGERLRLPAPRRRSRPCGSGGGSTPRSASTSAGPTPPAPTATCRPPGSGPPPHGLGDAADLRRPAGALLAWSGTGAMINPGQAAAEGGPPGRTRSATRGSSASPPARRVLRHGVRAGPGSRLLRHGGLRRRPELHQRGADVHRRVGPDGGRQGLPDRRVLRQDSGIDDMQAAAAARPAGFTRPDAIWIALWDGKPRSTTAPWAGRSGTGRSSTRATSTGTVGGITLSIDRDMVAGPMAR